MDFKRWLSENSQGIELQVAQFLEDMIDKAGQLFKQDPSQSFSSCLTQVWPAEAKSAAGLVLPANLGPVAGQLVSLKRMDPKTRAVSMHYNGQFGGFKLNVRINPQNIDADLESLKSAVHHEAEHINNPGADYDVWGDDDQDTKRQATMAYMSHPGEVRAHAREMARAYAKHFPGEPFDVTKAHSLLNQPYFNQTHRNYFHNLAEPGKWDQLTQKYGYQHENPHNQIIGAVQELLPQYSQNLK